MGFLIHLESASMESNPIATGFTAVGVAAVLYVFLLLVRRSRARKEVRNGNPTAGTNVGVSAPQEQALLVKIRLSDGEFGEEQERNNIHGLAQNLEKAISAQAGSGEYDGDEFGGGFCTLYMYGPSAARLFDITIPILLQFHAPSGSFVIKRYGSVGAKEEHIPLAPTE